MRQFPILLVAAGVAAAQTYTAVAIPGAAGSPGFANILALNNKGQVLGDACNNNNCTGLNRFPAVWSNGAMTPLPIPSGLSYVAQPAYYGINDSGVVVGTLQAGTDRFGIAIDHVVIWTNGVPTVLPDAPIAACLGPGYLATSSSFGINAAGHIVGATTYLPQGNTQSCSSRWVYNGSSFQFLPVPIPSQCSALPPGYYPGVTLGFGAAINDADQVLETLSNVFCAPPYIPPPGFPAADPFVIQTSGSSAFLPLGALAGATGTTINDLGNVLGYYTSPTHLVVWDKGGIHDLGPSGYGYMNQLGQVVYTQFSGGSILGFELWQNGVATPIQVPAGLILSGQLQSTVTTSFNDAGQFTLSIGSLAHYLLSPSGSCGQDVTAQVQITRGGFRYNRTTGHFTQTVTVTNTGASPITGPISLALDNISSNASLFGIAGATLCDVPQGSPYLNLAAASLDPGVPQSDTVEFIDTANTGITYGIRVLAGPGGR